MVSSSHKPSKWWGLRWWPSAQEALCVSLHASDCTRMHLRTHKTRKKLTTDPPSLPHQSEGQTAGQPCSLFQLISPIQIKSHVWPCTGKKLTSIVKYSPPCVASVKRGNTSRRREMNLVVFFTFVVPMINAFLSSHQTWGSSYKQPMRNVLLWLLQQWIINLQKADDSHF